jgi:hypothetical protein
MDYVITATDRALFKRCRRAWDFGGTNRRNLELAVPAGIDLHAAIREGLAVYYFPGMWEWQNRSMVQRLAFDAFDRSLRRQRAAAGDESVETDEDWERASENGTLLLKRYFRWAPTVDRFSPIRVNADFHVTLPDPRQPEADLVTRGGRRLVYTGTIDMLVIDEHDAYWLVNHRFTTGDWADVDLLVLDDVYASYCWAWERWFLGMTIAGVQYNEIRMDPSEDEPAAGTPSGEVAGVGETEGAEGPGVHMGGVAPMRRLYMKSSAVQTDISQQQEGPFRRTVVPRSPRELDALRAQMADEVIELSDPAVRLYPTPSPTNCRACTFRAPCLVVSEGNEPDVVLASSYRNRPPAEEGVAPRIGSETWSQNRGAAPMGWQERVRRPPEYLPTRPDQGPGE